MPETTTAPPPAPATTPAPAPAAAPAAAPAPPQTQQTITDPFGDVKPAPKPVPAPKTATPAPDKAGAAPVAPKPDAAKQVVKKNPLEEQRARIEQQNQVIASTTKERDELRQRIQALEKRGGGDTEAMTKLLEAERAKAQQLQAEISARDYSRSPEFAEKYEKPWNQAADRAKKVVESLKVIDSDGNPVRDAKWDTDFATIYHMPRSAARQRSKELFGEDAQDVMREYDNLHGLQDQKDTALQEWQKGATEREQKQRAETLMQRQNIQKAFQAVTEKFITDDSVFQIKPDDAENRALWDKSEAIVNKAYFEREKLSPPELVTLDAAIRLRAINEPVLRAKVARLEEELADYKAKFDEKEASTNGRTRKAAGSVEPPKTDVDWKSDLMTSLKAASPV